MLNATTGTGRDARPWMGPLLEADTEPRGLGIRALSVTPFRALARDLETALHQPLEFLGLPWRVEQRTGDTSSARRARQKTEQPDPARPLAES